MSHKCDGCFYKTGWWDGTNRFPVCEREWWESFEHCKAECEKPGPCEHYLSHEEANKIIDKLSEIPN